MPQTIYIIDEEFGDPRSIRMFWVLLLGNVASDFKWYISLSRARSPSIPLSPLWKQMSSLMFGTIVKDLVGLPSGQLNWTYFVYGSVIGPKKNRWAIARHVQSTTNTSGSWNIWVQGFSLHHNTLRGVFFFFNRERWGDQLYRRVTDN